MSVDKSITKYVCGFLVYGHSVALMRKNRPQWQVGKLNGIGGKIEDGETAAEAMRREFQEETGQDGFEWRETVKLSGVGFEVIFFVAFTDLSRLLDLPNECD